MKLNLRALAAIGAGLIIAGLLVYAYILTGQRDTARAQVTAEQQAHAATVANYRAAAAEATRRDAENRARIEAEQRAANERISHEYEARIVAVREQYARLLRERAGAGSGNARPAPVPPRGGATGQPDAAAPQDGFSLADRLIATEQAIQLEELQRYVRETVAIINGQPSD
jgi:hypothetical protein